MKTREVSLPQFILGEQEMDQLSIITGVPGAGKSFLAANARFPEGTKVLDIDSASDHVNGKWITQVAKAEDADIAFGTSDNLGEVAKAMRSSYDDNEPLTLYWVEPSHDIFKHTMAAKAKDSAAKAESAKSPEDVKRYEAYVADFSAKLKYSPSEFKKFISAKLENAIAKIQPNEVVIVTNKSANGPIVNGWHGSPVKQTPPKKQDSRNEE